MRRRAGESFLVGADIEIEILEVCGSRVKLGIVAPDAIVIQRKEAQITRDENLLAARSVQPVSISSLMRGVAVKDLTLPDSLTATDASVRRRKNIRTISALPDMNQ